MKNKFIRALSTGKVAIILLVLYIVLMASATFIEKFYGTDTAKALVYYSPLFIILHLLMILNFVLITVSRNLISRKKWSYMTIHCAFIVILGGAVITHFAGDEGMMRIREGEKTAYMVKKIGNGQVLEKLPFELELTDFKLVRYPGSKSPSSYESYLKIYANGEVRTEKVYMNNVLDLMGYRFYQASYDPDEMGTILSVNRDAAGRTVTYTGYILLFAGLLLSVFDRNSRLRRLLKQLGTKTAVLIIALISGTAGMSAQDLIIPAEHAEKFGVMPMQSANGRIVPVNTFASEILRKFKAEDLVGNMSPEQFLLSIMAYPQDWAVIPLVEVKDEEIASKYGFKTGRISYREAFDNRGDYKMVQEIEQIYRKNPSERNRMDKAMLKIDDRINIMHELLSDRMLRIYPNPSDSLNNRWFAAGEPEADSMILNLSRYYITSVRNAVKTGIISEADAALASVMQYQTENGGNVVPAADKLRAEVFYNRLNMLRLCRFGYLILGFIMLCLAFVSEDKNGMRKIVRGVLSAGVVLFFVMHTVSLGLRWYISGYAPWSNSYETMVSLAWAGVLCGFVFARRNYHVAALATLFGGIVLFVSSLSWMDPQITPLVPVLKSPWLMAHVASLVMAYGFLGICCMIGIAWLLISVSGKPKVKDLLNQMTVISEISMLLGLGLLTVGIFLGAVWANESWGRYWSWDPKETWALITMIVYAVVLHLKWFSKKNGDRLYNLLAQLSILSILMTFLGVNYFLSGMHSYGSHDALSMIPVWAYILFAVVFVVPGAVSYLFGKNK